MAKPKKNNIDFFAIIGFISAVISIVDFVKKSYENYSFTFSRLSIICIFIAVFSLLIFALGKSAEVRYYLKKFIVYRFSHSSEPLEVVEKESIYTVKDLKHMEFTKNHKIKSKVAQLSEFCDKFKWSKPQSMSEINQMCNQVKANNKNHKVTITRFENWIKYSVSFDGIGKGDTKDIGITIKNLCDPNEESLPFLSSSVVFKTEKMLMKVIFEDPSITPKKIEYKIYSNYASNYPLIRKELNFEHTSQDNYKYIEYTENKPIPGYRYVITWEY